MFALLAILACLLPVLIIAVLLKILSPGPLIFRHERVGFNGKRFKCLKFRTMVVDADERLQEYLKTEPDAQVEFYSNRKLREDPRVVPGIGNFLRTTSLDELPQFINVIVGDMSIVGPRPIVEEEMQLYGAHVKTYTRARPGITGLWQVSGRSSLSFAERVRLDVSYCENWSLRRDASIAFRTVGALLGSRNAC